MKKTLFYIFTIFCLASCSEVEDWFNSEDAKNAVELSGVEASVYGSEKTRAAALDKENYVGRSVFIHQDQMVLTTIKRTPQPSATPPVGVIPGFSYKGIVYDHEVAQGQTAGGWNRDESKGWTEESATTVPEKIYWSDASNWHTYIGYSLPQQADGVTFDWKMTNTYDATATVGLDTYYGSIGDPTVPQTETNGVISNYIDYTNDANDAGVIEYDKNNHPIGKSYKTGNEKIKHDDLLLTFDDEKLAEPGGSVAKLYYHHALANVRIVVNISGFSATSESADALSIVENMVLKNMLTMYKWKQQSYGAEALNETYDKDKLSDIYNNLPDGHSVPEYNQKKDVHMWIPRKDGTGSGVGKQFVFYALAVPTTMAANELEMHFNVKYQDPMEPWTDAEHTVPNMENHLYKAKMPQEIVFRAGWCTTINISLNHNNENMTVGAEYMDWEFDPSPDEGELKKNSTLLQGTDRHRVTIFGDVGHGEDNVSADADDATWLYVDPKNNSELRDIYGNNGSKDHPFIISTEEQLLSFAYEVKGTSRTEVTYKNIVSNSEVTIPAGGAFDFKGYYVKLDADITLQKSITVTETTPLINWIGIGDDSHHFNGVFLGSGRHINNLYGQPFFNVIGTDAVVDKIDFANVVSVEGTGVVANKNYGVLCACNVEGNVAQSKPADVANSYCGSFVGENDSFIIACAHEGTVSGYGTVGGLVGFNNGTVMASYHSGVVEAKNESGTKIPENAHPTVGAYGDGTGEGANKTNNSIMFSCYYDKDVFTDSRTLVTGKGKLGYPLPTTVMQSNAFVGKDEDDKSFVFDESGNVDTNGPILREIAETVVKDRYPDMTEDEIKSKTNPELILLILPQNVFTDEVLKVFEYHFSLNTAIRVFKYWIARIHAQDLYTVETNCHTFTKAQIDFLNEHYNDEHQYYYTPATYPKVR